MCLPCTAPARRLSRALAVFVVVACLAPALRAGAAPVAAPAAPAPAAGISADTAAGVRRLLTVLEAIGEEYREGVADGAVTRPIEYQEAQAFLQDAQQQLQDLTPQLAAGHTALASGLAAVAAAVTGKAPPQHVAARLAALRQQLVTLTGVSDRVYPPAAPSAARGRALFAETCASCHGARGDGRGPKAAGLNPPPADFTDPHFIHGETPYDFYHVISLGKPHTAMPAWGQVLSVQDRWDLISYLWTLTPGDTGLAEGQGIYLMHCAACHGASGDGHGVFSPTLLRPAPDLSRLPALARQSDAALFAAASDGVAGTPMPAFARTLSVDERWKAVAFMRTLSLGGGAPTPGAPPRRNRGSAAPETGKTAAAAALAQAGRLLDAAVAAYGRGDPQAAGMATDAYLHFDPLEQAVGASDPALKTRIEENFLNVRQQMRRPGNDTAVQALAAAMHRDLEAAQRALQPRANRDALFVEAATIILREGLEIVLVIGALIAYVLKTGNPSMRRGIYAGTLAGVAASLATAFLMGELFHLHPGSSDVLEGFTMLLAAVVLFWVSYWLVSKSEAVRWQRYIRGKVETALSGGSSLALAGAAFLAVYREGFETVLFYQALYASAPGAGTTVLAGLLAGSVALAAVYLVFRRFQVRIPLQQFFFVTGLLLYVMAAIFAGQGVHELQEAGVVGVSAVGWIPAVPLLGIYPSLQSLLVQAVFVALLAYATLVTVRRRRAAAAGASRDGAAVQLQAVRNAVDALRQEIERAGRAAPSALPAPVRERVQGLLVCVEQLVDAVRQQPPANGGRGAGH